MSARRGRHLRGIRRFADAADAFPVVMHASEPRILMHRGQKVALYTCRNDGFAWGRVVMPDGTQFDLEPQDGEGNPHDLYDETDVDALEWLQDQMSRGPAWFMWSVPGGWSRRRPIPRTPCVTGAAGDVSAPGS